MRRLALPVLGLAALLLCGCGTDDPDDAPSLGAPTPSLGSPTTPPGYDPAIVVVAHSESVDEPVADITGDWPTLTGVDAAVAESFDDQWREKTEIALAEVGELVASWGPEDPAFCPDVPVRDGVPVLPFKGGAVTTEVFGDYATATVNYVWGTCEGAVWNGSVVSLTVDARNGEPVALTAFADPTDAHFRELVAASAVQACKDSPRNKKLVLSASDLENWNPTELGLVVTLPKGTVPPMVCGMVTVLVPWDETGGPLADQPPDQ